MKRELINKIILGAMISTTLFTLIPTKASAEWVNDYQGNWYYMNNSERVTGWKKIDGQLYYFDDNGKMQKGWIRAGDSWYFLQDNGVMKTGWINYGKNWYYADSNGAIQTGIINIQGKIYIFDDNGVMKTSNTFINGEFYTIDSNGEVAGTKIPTPDKEFDSSGNCVKSLNNTDNKVVNSPTSSQYDKVVEDETVSDADPNEGRKFKLTLKNSDGSDLDIKTVKYGKSIDLDDFDEPAKSGYVFKGWNTKSDGSGKSYDSGDKIKLREDTILYPQWSDDTNIYANDIIIKGNPYVTVNKTIQLTAEISPSDTTNKGVTWSVADGTGKATIDSNGVLTGVSAGTIIVTATTKDGSKLSANKEITVSATDIATNITGISVTSKTGKNVIDSNAGTLQMVATVYPDYADQGVTWSIKDGGTGSATIDNNGLVTAVSDGVVTVKATSNSDPSKSAETSIRITGQSNKVALTDVGIAAQNNSDLKIDKDGGTLQLIANMTPSSASIKSVVWSITSGQNVANLSSTGLLKALANGTVTVKVTVTDQNGNVKDATQDINISNQSIKVDTITINTPDTIDMSSNATKTITLDATVMGKDSTTPSSAELKWTVTPESGNAKIIDAKAGTLQAESDGKVLVKAEATDGSGVTATKEITITGTGQLTKVTSIVITGTDGKTDPYIDKDDGTLDLRATISPSYASTTAGAVTWEVHGGSNGINDGGEAKIVGNTNGSTTKIQAFNNGTVTVYASVIDPADNNLKKIGTLVIPIDGQITQVNSINITTPNNTRVGVGETLQMQATVGPADATNKNIRWEVINGTGTDGGTASFDDSTKGILRGGTKGWVKVQAVSTDGYGFTSDPVIINVVGPYPAHNVDISATSNNVATDKITTDKGTLQMTATVDANYEPADESATNKAVTWSVASKDGKGQADITKTSDATAILTASQNGVVTVTATGSGGASKSMDITINGQNPRQLIVGGLNGANEIDTTNGTLQMQYALDPSNSTTPAAVTWSVANGTGKATIDPNNGILQGSANGTVTVTATATTADGKKIIGSAIITINGVTGVEIAGGSPDTPVEVGHSVKLTANVAPSTVNNKTVTWSIANTDPNVSDVLAAFTNNADGSITLTGMKAGWITVTATSNADSSKKGQVNIQIK